MAKTIEGVPEFIAREDYIKLIDSIGIDPRNLRELRFTRVGVYAIVFESTAQGGFVIDPDTEEPVKSRIFIPIRDSEDDKRTTRVRPVKEGK